MTNSPNIDPQEVEKFEKLAHQWWDMNGPMQPLHQLNPLRLQFILNHVDLTQKRVLDVGCGAGILTESLAHAGAVVTGVDASESVIQVAKQHAAKSQLTIDYQHSLIEQFQSDRPTERLFDVITCMELLEHVPDPAAFIHTCSELLAPHGFIFFSTLNRNIKSFLGAIIGAEYLLNMLPKGTHEYAKFIRPSELDQWAQQAGLTLNTLQGIRYQPFTKQYSFNQDVSINYLACFQKIK